MAVILLVEDNRLNQDMLARRLRRQGYDVACVDDGIKALAAARKATPDLILMDMTLPVLDGWETTRRLRQDPDTAEIPVIALTAHAMEGDRRRALDAGCDDYASKPVDFPDLLRRIDAQLTRDSSPTDK